MMNDSCNNENLEVHNVVKSDLNLPEGKSKNDTMVIIIPDVIAKLFSGIYYSFMEYK
jgi:hypothetical protein